MATLLTIPQELRDQVLREALSLARAAPPAPSADLERICLRNVVDPYWARTTNIYVERGPADGDQAALLKTCRQLRAETQYILKGAEARPYLLDVLLVKNCGLFPTWLSFPRRQKHIGEVYVQMRISDPPERTIEEWLEAARYPGRDSDGSIQTGWNIIFLLTVYVLGGFHDTTTLPDRETAPGYEEEEEDAIFDDDAFNYETRNIADYTIKTLIVDVISQPNSSAGVEEGQERRNIFGHCIFHRGIHQRIPRHWADEPVGSAQKLTLEMQWSLRLATDVNYPYALYARLLWENVGVIDIRMNGVSVEKIDVSAELRGRFGSQFEVESLPDPEGMGSLSRDARWAVEAVKKRKRAGLWEEEAPIERLLTVGVPVEGQNWVGEEHPAEEEEY